MAGLCDGRCRMGGPQSILAGIISEAKLANAIVEMLEFAH
jgi:hypothetical protein